MNKGVGKLKIKNNYDMSFRNFDFWVFLLSLINFDNDFAQNTKSRISLNALTLLKYNDYVPILLMCDSGIDEENVVSEYLAHLGEEELYRLEEIYRWKQHHRIFFKSW